YSRHAGDPRCFNSFMQVVLAQEHRVKEAAVKISTQNFIQLTLCFFAFIGIAIGRQYFKECRTLPHPLLRQLKAIRPNAKLHGCLWADISVDRLQRLHTSSFTTEFIVEYSFHG